MIGAIGAVGAYYGHDAAESLDDILDASFTIGLGSDRYAALKAKLGNSAWATGIQVFYSTKSTAMSRMQLLVGSTGRCVTRYYYNRNNAWGEWQAVATTDYAVNKAGDTMTGDLEINNPKGKTGIKLVVGAGTTGIMKWGDMSVDNGTLISDYNNSLGETYGIILSVKNKKVQLQHVNSSGGQTLTDFLHTGNKPSGSYVGTGEAWTELLPVGGIGEVLLIQSSMGIALVTRRLILSANAATSAVTVHPVSTNGQYVNGNLNIISGLETINKAGETYYYQVL